MKSNVKGLVMIQTEDYYKQIPATIANSVHFSASGARDDSMFPTEGIYIGEFESLTGHRLPALLSLEETGGICFLSQLHSRGVLNQVIQSIMLRTAASLPTGLCRVVAYDGLGLGTNLIALSNLDPQTIQGIITDPREFLTALRGVQQSIPRIIQHTLGHRYADSTLIEYNQHERKNAHPYTFLVINDFPRTLTREHVDLLETILKDGKRVGIYVIMTLDTTSADETQPQNDIMPIMDYLTTIYAKDDRYYIRNSAHDRVFRKYTLHLDTDFMARVSEIMTYMKARKES